VSKSSHPLEALIGIRNQVLVDLIYGAGLKVSDLSSLKMNHISLGSSPRVLITPLKRDPYSIPLSENFVPLFKRYQEFLTIQKEKDYHEFDDFLFNANPYRILSGGLSPRGIETVFKELRGKLDIVLTPKSLRQACIFNWLGQKKKESLIKEWLGVAPSYSLKLYKDHLDSHAFHDEFLKEIQ